MPVNYLTQNYKQFLKYAQVNPSGILPRDISLDWDTDEVLTLMTALRITLNNVTMKAAEFPI